MTDEGGAVTTATTDRDRRDFRHEALLYAGRDEFLDGTASFIEQGVAANEPVFVVVSGEKIELLRDRLDGQAARVRFADMGDVGTNPARIIPAWGEFVDENAGRGSFRGIGEPIWAGRTAAELVECQRHESLLNLAFAGTPAFRLLCPYDTDALCPDVIEEARRSHPIVVQGDAEWESADYRGLEAVAAPFDVALPDPPPDAEELSFAAHDLHAVRDFVRRKAQEAGLGTARAGDLILAVGEVAANSVRHGGGEGMLRVWTETDAIVCDVRDRGFIESPLVGRERPTVDWDSGRGLWLANLLCELLQIRSSEWGTVVRLHVRLA
jgi:anti-sigma regulatory factor (Ser/Thr protein kinase)